MTNKELNKQAFNLEGFLEKQREIYKKFIPPTAFNTTLERFDKLIMNLTEEMLEYEMEFQSFGCTSDDKIEMIKELIDVIMYTGTCMVVWQDEYSVIFKETLPVTLFVNPINFHYKIFTLFHQHYFDSVAIRRNFSERKWHKPINPNEEKEETVKQLLNIQLRYLKEYIYQLLYLLDNDIDNLNKMILEKQDFILSL